MLARGSTWLGCNYDGRPPGKANSLFFSVGWVFTMLYQEYSDIKSFGAYCIVKFFNLALNSDFGLISLKVYLEIYLRKFLRFQENINISKQKCSKCTYYILKWKIFTTHMYSK